MWCSAKFIIDCERNLIKATTTNAAFQLYNESIIKGPEHNENTWYPINGEYGWWVLKHEFPNTKGDEFIEIEYN